MAPNPRRHAASLSGSDISLSGSANGGIVAPHSSMQDATATTSSYGGDGDEAPLHEIVCATAADVAHDGHVVEDLGASIHPGDLMFGDTKPTSRAASFETTEAQQHAAAVAPPASSVPALGDARRFSGSPVLRRRRLPAPTTVRGDDEATGVDATPDPSPVSLSPSKRRVHVTCPRDVADDAVGAVDPAHKVAESRRVAFIEVAPGLFRFRPRDDATANERGPPPPAELSADAQTMVQAVVEMVESPMSRSESDDPAQLARAAEFSHALLASPPLPSALRHKSTTRLLGVAHTDSNGVSSETTGSSSTFMLPNGNTDQLPSFQKAESSSVFPSTTIVSIDHEYLPAPTVVSGTMAPPSGSSGEHSPAVVPVEGPRDATAASSTAVGGPKPVIVRRKRTS